MYESLPTRTYPPAWRVLAAFVIVPGIAAIAIAVFMPLYAGLPSLTERIWRSAVVYGVVGAYPATVILGIPAYFMLRRHFDPSILACSVVGGIVAALPWLFLTLISVPDQASIGNRATVIDGTKTAYGWLMDAQLLGQIALFGALGGALFWLVAAAGSERGKVR